MEPRYLKNAKYKVAQKRVKDIKGFYIHLSVYLFINIAIVIYLWYKKDFNTSLMQIEDFYFAFFWGIGLFSHWISVFGHSFLLGKNWEEKKIREIMRKEQKLNSKWE